MALFWEGSSLGGTFRRAVLRRPAPALFSVIEGLCVTPLAVPLAVHPLLGFGTCQGNSRAASPAHANSQPALREPLRLRKERDSGRHLDMGASPISHMRILSIHGDRAVAGETRFPSAAAGLWKSARRRTGTPACRSSG